MLSIAAGVPTAGSRPASPPVPRSCGRCRTHPALVGAGAAAIAAGSAATDDDLAWAESILAAVGTVVRVAESLLDAVTGLSGSGPAYVFLVAEALIEAGVLVGLPRGRERRARPSRPSPARLDCSRRATILPRRCGPRSPRPGGTTAAGLRVLDDAGMVDALVDAVAAATARSRELGRQLIPSRNRPFRGAPPVVYSPDHAEKGLSMAQIGGSNAVPDRGRGAQSLRVSTMTVYRLMKAGELGATRVGKSYRISESDLDHYLASRYTQAG